MKLGLKTYIIFISLALASGSAFAQKFPPAPTKASPPPPIGLVVPIDENIMFLLIIGFVFGLYVVVKSRKKLA